jgi:multiple sugar transport system substrate-binding protein
MMNFRKTTAQMVAILLVSVTALGFAQEPVTISYWTLFTGGDKEFMDAMVEQFMEENPDIIIDQTTSRWENFYDFLTTSMAGGNAPDVAIIHATRIPGFAVQGALHPLDELIAEAELPEEDFLPIPWELSQYEGTRYAVPLDIHTLVLFYNKQILEEAGLLNEDGTFEQPDSREGWLEVFETLKERTDATPWPLASLGSAAYRDWFSLLHQNGGQLITDDGTRAAFNSPEGIDALQFWVDHVRTHQYSPDGLTFPQTFTMFQEGDSAMEGYGAWRTGAYEAIEGLEFDVGPYPVFGDQPAMFADSHVFVLPAQRTRDEAKDRAALRFIDWMTSNTIMWTEAGHIPPRVSVIESEEYQSLPHRPYKDLAALENIRYPPLQVNILEIETIILEEIQAALGGVKTSERALADAEQRVNSILAR